MKNTRLFVLLAVVLLLLIASLACKQAGEIITPAEATQRYEGTQSAFVSDVTGDVEGAEFLAGTEATLASQEFLINIVRTPGETDAFAYGYRGDKVTVEGSSMLDGEIWYRVDTFSGSGWVPAKNLAPLEDE
jgi:uncharacterized lipoprotein YehR (DUF1307 family)